MNLHQQAESDHRLGEAVRKTLEKNEHMAIVCELEQCPKCREQVLAIHAFVEVMHCPTCGQRFATSAPPYPTPKEVTVADWELAVSHMSIEFPTICLGLTELARSIAEERSAAKL